MGSNPAEDNQGYEPFGEIALKNQRFFYIFKPRVLCSALDCIHLACLLAQLNNVYAYDRVLSSLEKFHLNIIFFC